MCYVGYVLSVVCVMWCVLYVAYSVCGERCLLYDMYDFYLLCVFVGFMCCMFCKSSMCCVLYVLCVLYALSVSYVCGLCVM